MLTQCLEAVRNWLQLIPSKMTWFRVFGPSGASDVSVSQCDGTFQIELVYNLEIPLVSWLLFKEQVAATAGGDLCTDSSCVSVVSISGTRSFAQSHSYSSHFPFGLLHKDTFEDHSEITVGPECSSTGKFGTPWFALIISLLCKLCWLPVSFWIEFKVMVLTFKALHGSELGYLLNCLP